MRPFGLFGLFGCGCFAAPPQRKQPKLAAAVEAQRPERTSSILATYWCRTTTGLGTWFVLTSSYELSVYPSVFVFTNLLFPSIGVDPSRQRKIREDEKATKTRSVCVTRQQNQQPTATINAACNDKPNNTLHTQPPLFSPFHQDDYCCSRRERYASYPS